MVHEVEDVQVQAQLVLALRTLIGGPGSLRAPSDELLPALAGAIGRLCALTLRTTADIDSWFDDLGQRVTDEMRALFREAEPLPGPLVPLAKVEPEAILILHALASVPNFRKKPSHLVLGALVTVTAQLAELRGTSRAEVLAIVEAARQSTPAGEVKTFQRLSARQKKQGHRR